MLAVAKAGGVYLPLDIGYPDERLRRVLDDARPSIVVTRDPARVRRLSPEGVVTVDPTQPQHPDGDLDVSVRPDDVAYLIYTSGSTGTPKGVLATHRGLANLTAAKIDLFDVRPDSRVLQFVSLGFGVSIADVHMTLCAGATLVMRGDGALSGADLVALVQRHRVTNLVLPASVLAAVPAEDLPSVRCVAVGGEPCAASLVDRWAPGRRFVNAYGPTEATVATATAVCRAGGGTPPIGRPIPGSRLYVLDDGGRLVPPGVPGELYVAGIGVTRGYHRAPDLTAQRFRPDPFGPGRMYRTGDRARWRPDGQLVLLGRLDDQVNLRGVRIELGDVEAALSAHPAVAEAAAAIQDHPVAGQRLVGYLVDTPGTPRPDAVELRRFLTERVPEHFVPAVFMRLPALPRTATGKLDRRALPGVDDAARVPSRAPEGITEEVLADIWRDVLADGRDPGNAFGADDDFFALGGQSILAASVMAQIRARFEVTLPVRALFDAPTIAGLADRVEQAIIADLTGESR
jgi:amino acid adenylation domain-containing protein